MSTHFFDRRDWSLGFPMSTQYFYDENGQRIVDPVAQQAWVKQHPEHPYGYGVPLGDGPKEDPPEPIVDEEVVKLSMSEQWAQGRYVNHMFEYLWLAPKQPWIGMQRPGGPRHYAKAYGMPTAGMSQCDCGDCNDCYFRDAGNPSNYIKC
jgi:hypothetical protein